MTQGIEVISGKMEDTISSSLTQDRISALEILEEVLPITIAYGITRLTMLMPKGYHQKSLNHCQEGHCCLKGQWPSQRTLEALEP